MKSSNRKNNSVLKVSVKDLYRPIRQNSCDGMKRRDAQSSRFKFINVRQNFRIATPTYILKSKGEVGAVKRINPEGLLIQMLLSSPSSQEPRKSDIGRAITPSLSKRPDSSVIRRFSNGYENQKKCSPCVVFVFLAINLNIFYFSDHT